MTQTVGAATIAALLVLASPAGAATVEGRATIDGTPAAHAVVYLESLSSPVAAPPARRVVVDQKNLTFEPRVLPVTRGTVVEFKNSDNVQHNVFSPSAIAGKFDLGTYGPGAVRTVTLDQPGDVRVLCNIHMEMEAHVLVLDGPYFTTAAEDGSYRVSNVPPGTYHVKLWQRGWRGPIQTVEVPATGTRLVDIEAER